jgi:large subunit ribosomal protein L35
MPKQRAKKSHRGIAKRFKVSKHGQIKGTKAGYHHKLIKRSSKAKRQARRGLVLHGKVRKNIGKLLSA